MKPPYTLQQLERFIKVRNEAISHSNAQFEIDAEECLGDGSYLEVPMRVQENGLHGFMWITPYGCLREVNHRLTLTLYSEEEEYEEMQT